MHEQALSAAAPIAGRLLMSWGSLSEPELLLRAAAMGYVAGTGIPADRAVAMVEDWAARGLVRPAVGNPLFPGVSWMVPGPAAGAPYYYHPQ